MSHDFMAFSREAYPSELHSRNPQHRFRCCNQSFFFFILLFLASVNTLRAYDIAPLHSVSSILPGSLESHAEATPLADNPNFTIRFANPQFNCSTGEYCLDVELQSDLLDQQLFGINVRFFYEDNILEFIDFRDFQGGYGPVAPNPPQVLTSPPAFGYNYFHFGSPGNGAADWVNGAVQLVDYNQPPLYISTTDWTKVFQVCFEMDDPAPDSTHFCPSIVLDLEQDPANGGYLAGDEGVVMTATTAVPGESTPAFEHVVQFNWHYTGDGQAPPYGDPEETTCIPFSCGMNITCPADITVSCGASTLPSETGYAVAEDNCPGVPVLTYVDTFLQGLCGNTETILRTWTASDSCGNLNNCIQIITIQNIGSICGAVYDDLGAPSGGIEIKLYTDQNANQVLDSGDSLLATWITDAITGSYSFNALPPCAYVVVESQPMGMGSLADTDVSPDPDGDDSADGPDNEIPVTVSPCESDSGNIFTDILCSPIFPVLPSDSICDGQSVTFSIDDLNIGSVNYSWDFGSGSMPSSASGIGPHTITYISTPGNLMDGAIVDITFSKTGCPDTTVQVSAVDINPYPDATINGSTEAGCYFSNRTFVPLQAEIPGASYSWNFGENAVPSTATGYGPHIVYYEQTGEKTVSLHIMPGDPGAQCPDSATIAFMIQACPAQISGIVKSETNQPIPNVNVRLYADADTNGVADNGTIIRSVFTNSVGSFSMGSLTPGNFVMVEMQPSGWYSMDDGDLTNDGDIVSNIDPLDNIIPVTLNPAELDAANFFTETPIAGSITGAVFDDLDNDQVPDPGEGLEGVLISLFQDVNLDGVADTPVPVQSSSSGADGQYTFASVPVGNYVMVETQPSGYASVKEFDASDDNDPVPNSNMTNDTLPVTITNAETDQHNYFLDHPACNLLVSNTNDSGSGSLRDVLECAADGDTIRFSPTLEGTTIMITSDRLLIDKNVTLYSECIPRITIGSQVVGLFDIGSGHTVKYINLNMVSGLSGNGGAAFNNYGDLKMKDVIVTRNSNLPPGEYLIQNHGSSQLWLEGVCQLLSD